MRHIMRPAVRYSKVGVEVVFITLELPPSVFTCLLVHKCTCFQSANISLLVTRSLKWLKSVSIPNKQTNQQCRAEHTKAPSP